MNHQGHIEKMESLVNGQVQYTLPLDDIRVAMNPLLGQQVKLTFLNEIKCVSCGKIINKTYGQGFCYPCFTTVPEADECVLSPEKCRAHLGVSRDMTWAESHCLIPHIVYLAMSGNVKVGITRHTQMPTRWIDQGASSAIVLAQTPNRHIAGVIEVFLKQHFSDKTLWQKMLCSPDDPGISLAHEKHKAVELLPAELRRYVWPDDSITELQYPYTTGYPSSVEQVTFDKQNCVEGELTAMRGQYLIFDNQRAVNIRRHRGYLIRIEV